MLAIVAPAADDWTPRMPVLRMAGVAAAFSPAALVEMGSRERKRRVRPDLWTMIALGTMEIVEWEMVEETGKEKAVV